MVERVVSLAPSATATLRTLGRGELLVGRTEHESGAGTSVGGWLTPNLETIEQLDPDLVITTDALQGPIVESLEDRGIPTAHFSPGTVADVLTYVRHLGAAVDSPDEGESLAIELKERLRAVRTAVEGRPRPVVYCEEWQNPPMVAGNWIPDAVEIAGGRYPFLEPGERSRGIDADEVEATGATHAVLHICGHGRDVDTESLARRGWSIPAISRGQVTVVDDALLNQPSPKLVEGIERLAGFLHPETVPAGSAH